MVGNLVSVATYSLRFIEPFFIVTSTSESTSPLAPTQRMSRLSCAQAWNFREADPDHFFFAVWDKLAIEAAGGLPRIRRIVLLGVVTLEDAIGI